MEQVILIPGGGTCCLLTAGFLRKKMGINCRVILFTKELRFILAMLITAGASLSSMAHSASSEPWALNQLMLRADLVKVITDKHKPQPVVFSIGPDAFKRGSNDLVSVQGKANLAYFAEHLSEILKDANIVIYCVCCPFDHGVNIRTAVKLLNDMKFSNYLSFRRI